MGKITKNKKAKKVKSTTKTVQGQPPFEIYTDHSPIVDMSLLNGWDSLSIPRDSRLLRYTKAVRQESINSNTLTDNKLARLTDSVFDSLSAVNKSIASGKVENARLKTRIDINQDALERTDQDLHKLTQSVSNLGLKTSKNSEAIVALVDRSKPMSQDIKILQMGLIITAIISVVDLVVTLLK